MNDNEPDLPALIGAALAASQQGGPSAVAMQGALMAWACSPSSIPFARIALDAIDARADAMQAEASALKALSGYVAERDIS